MPRLTRFFLLLLCVGALLPEVRCDVLLAADERSEFAERGNTMVERVTKKRDGEWPMPDLSTLPPDGGKEYNRLIFAASPYLLQHSRNPVDWFPWSSEAFEKALRENKPIFLSIGYSTCHWCHVMAHESFEDQQVADFLNAHFVSIKIDREERPDIDHVYMDVCQTMTGGGGWPLTIFMTPEKRPFLAGTYFPKESRFGQPGFLGVLQQISRQWKSSREGILKQADRISSFFKKPPAPATGTVNFDLIDKATSRVTDAFDETWGGFGHAPKFPMGHLLSFLLRQYNRSEDEKVLQTVRYTLGKMHEGGLYDHLGFGFCRYSVDERWFAPHFEKMLYDNALLMMAYADAFQITREPGYVQIIREIATYVTRDMTDASGAFYSAENADSEGREGWFYLFSYDEILTILGEKDGLVAAKYFGATPKGNFEDGKNILYLANPLSEKDRATMMAGCREKLYQARRKRIHPSLDDKIIVSWNGLMIAALARSGQILNDPGMVETARRAAETVVNRFLQADGRLLHCGRGKTAGPPAFLDDYAFLIWGFLDVYEATLEASFLVRAVDLTERMLADFGNLPGGALRFTSAQSEPLFVDPTDGFEGAIPSGNSAAALDLVRLARMTGNQTYEKRAEKIIQAFSEDLERFPSGFPVMLSALDHIRGPSFEIVLTGQGKDSIKGFLEVLHRNYLPRMVLVFRDVASSNPDLLKVAGFVKDYGLVQGKPAAYVCQDSQCHEPFTSPEELENFLKKAVRR